jgi:hypothetical protein
VNLAFALVALQNYSFQIIILHDRFQDSIRFFGEVVGRDVNSTFWTSDIAVSFNLGQIDREEFCLLHVRCLPSMRFLLLKRREEREALQPHKYDRASSAVSGAF